MKMFYIMFLLMILVVVAEGFALMVLANNYKANGNGNNSYLAGKIVLGGMLIIIVLGIFAFAF